MKVFIFILPGIFFISCNNHQPGADNNSHNQVDTIAADVSGKKRESAGNVPADNPAVNDSVAARQKITDTTIAAGRLPVKRLKETITSNDQSVHVKISGLEKCTLSIILSHSDPHANIRISQLIMPDGSADGPFGRQLVYKIKKPGDYTIIISKSNMASGSPVGEVWVSIDKK